MIRGLGFVAKDAMEIAADSDCRRLRCAVAAERSEGRATHRERGDSRAKRVPSDNRQSSAVLDILDRIYRINRIGVVEMGRVG